MGSVGLCPQIPAPVVKGSSDDFVETQSISRMSTGGSEGRSDETPRPTKTRNVTCKEHEKTSAQAPVPQRSLPTPSTLKADIFGKQPLPERLEFVSLSVLGFYFWLLKVNTGDKNRAALPFQTIRRPVSVAHLAFIKTQAPETLKRAKRRTRPSSHTENVVLLGSPLNFLSPSSPHNGPIRS